MNRNQQNVVVISSVLLALTALFPAWVGIHKISGDDYSYYLGHHFVWLPPLDESVEQLSSAIDATEQKKLLTGYEGWKEYSSRMDATGQEKSLTGYKEWIEYLSRMDATGQKKSLTWGDRLNYSLFGAKPTLAQTSTVSEDPRIYSRILVAETVLELFGIMALASIFFILMMDPGKTAKDMSK